MHLHIISLFPEIFDSFLSTSLLQKAQEKKLLSFHCINPRDYCSDKHQQIDDQVYGGGAGMLIKAQPIIDAVEEIITSLTKGGAK
jgi:tRNA (guanine37-N1)-methyltransferase